MNQLMGKIQMSRSIKFRAWDKFQQTYVFSGFHICGEVTCFGGMEQEISITWEERSAQMGYHYQHLIHHNHLLSLYRI